VLNFSYSNFLIPIGMSLVNSLMSALYNPAEAASVRVKDICTFQNEQEEDLVKGQSREELNELKPLKTDDSSIRPLLQKKLELREDKPIEIKRNDAKEFSHWWANFEQRMLKI